MEDITQQIQNAIALNVLWKVNEFFVIVEILKNKNYEISYWENEENWATIIKDGKIIGYLWMKYPLLFVDSNSLKLFQDILQDYEFIIFITVYDFDKKEFKINYQNLKDEIDFGINPMEFSATDFWFYTNSK